jgi:Tol biopolymer transport system component
MPAMHSSLDWSPDGKWLAAGVQEPRETSGIFLVPVEQGEKRRLTSNSAGVDHSPQFSRDGKALAYVSCTGVYSCDVFILELASGWAPKGQPRRLTGPSASVQGIAWSADGQSIVYATSTAAAASHYLWRISVSGSAEPESLALGDSRARYPAIAREGRRLAYSRYTADSDIW